MRLTAARLLWLLAAMLAAVIAAEMAPQRQQGPTSSAAALPHALPVASAAADPIDTWVAATLARPLFSVDRRPPAETATASALGRQDLPRLAGIVVSSTGRSAIFAGEADHSTVVTEGTALGPYRVVAIHADTVDVTGPDGARTVKPAYSNSPPPPPQQAGIAQPMAPFSAALAGLQAYSQPNSSGIPMIAQPTPNTPNYLRPQR